MGNGLDHAYTVHFDEWCAFFMNVVYDVWLCACMLDK